MVSEVSEYVPADKIYAVTVCGLSFDTFPDRDAIWRNFGKDRRLNFNILTMLKCLLLLIL